jgi:TonB family protein
MKTCPRCGKTYPDSETFCEADGTALTSGTAPGGRRTTVMTDDPESGDGGVIECPVCGGKAQPGEVICNFCGTRLVSAAGEAAAAPPGGAARTHVSPEAFVPASERGIGQFERGYSRPLGGPTESDDERSASRGILGIVGFALAAALALAGGAWLAIYLSNRHATPPIAQASPSPAAVSSPSVMLAKTISIQTAGDMAGVMQRDPKSLGKVFTDNTAGLENVYRDALTSSPGLSDGMILRLHITPDGTVSDGSVRISTSPNPSLDAAVVKAASGWKYAPASGTGVDADYPIIFAGSAADATTVESDLNTKVASLGPSTTPEYALSPALPASPAEAVASPSAEATPPSAASLPPVETAPMAPRPARHKPVIRHPPLIERVNDALHSDRKLRRVQAYNSGSAITLSGKVFDDNERMVAEQTVRGVRGVSSVTNDLTTDTSEWERNTSVINQHLQSAGLTGVTVKVIGKRAYLRGEVKTELDRERAVSVTQGAAPVVVGTNLIRVVPGGVFGF